MAAASCDRGRPGGLVLGENSKDGDVPLGDRRLVVRLVDGLAETTGNHDMSESSLSIPSAGAGPALDAPGVLRRGTYPIEVQAIGGRFPHRMRSNSSTTSSATCVSVSE